MSQKSEGWKKFWSEESKEFLSEEFRSTLIGCLACLLAIVFLLIFGVIPNPLKTTGSGKDTEKEIHSPKFETKPSGDYPQEPFIKEFEGGIILYFLDGELVIYDQKLERVLKVKETFAPEESRYQKMKEKLSYLKNTQIP